MGYINCCTCGIQFHVPDTWHDARRNDHASFYCPNGHQQAFLGKSEAEKLREERDRLAQRIAQRDDEIREAEKKVATATKKIKRLQKRASAGVCPCCNRTFSNMAAHMKTCHGDVDPNVVNLDDAKRSLKRKA